MQFYQCALALMAWPAISYGNELFDKTDVVTSIENKHHDEKTRIWGSWEEEMEEALRNLDIELEKVAQKRILEESQTKMEEDYSEDDVSGYEYEKKRILENEKDDDKDVEYQPKSKEECEKFNVTFTSDKDVHFHTPDGCVGWGIDHEHTSCDKLKGEYPMTCTFYQNLTDTSAVDEVMRQLTLNEPKMKFDESLEKEYESLDRNLKRGRTTKQQQWFSTAAKKQQEGKSERACSAAGHGRLVRGLDCDTCWVGPHPYPCSCSCRGWEQHNFDCWKPCSEYNDDYTQTVGLYCFKPCDREGQVALNVGCGLTPADRICAESTGDCSMNYVNHAVSILDVLSTVLSGGVAGAFEDAAYTAAKAGSKPLAKAGLRAALKAAAKQFASELWKSAAIQRKILKYNAHMNKELKNRVAEHGSELFLAASMKTEPDWGGMALEIAEALDPTGIFGLVRGFIPPESCDASVYMDEDIPAEESNLPDLDPLDTI
jgi:hypothetical protein